MGAKSKTIEASFRVSGVGSLRFFFLTSFPPSPA